MKRGAARVVMNQLRIKNFTPQADSHRPRPEFWGPSRRMSDGALLDLDREQDALLPLPGKCPICSRHVISFVANVYGWPVHECAACGVGFVWPQPHEELLQSFYDAHYWADYMGDERPLYYRPELCSHIFKRQAQCFDRIMKGRREARVLDIGSGDGTMLRLLADIGYKNVLGIDINETNARRARELLGVQVEAAAFLAFDEGGWDAITLWAVIEHLSDPVSYLRHARKLLKPGGMFILMTGDNASAQARVQGVLDMWVYPPEHLFYFTRRSLRSLYGEAGYSGFRCQLQFQPLWKESALWSLRMVEAMKARLNPRGRFWRSVNSNLLVARGFKGGANPGQLS